MQQAVHELTPATTRPILALPGPLGDAREGVLRVLYLGRFTLATAIFVAAIAVWRHADTSATLIATLAFVSALLFTAGSIFYSARKVGLLADTFFYLALLNDAVHNLSDVPALGISYLAMRWA